MDSIVILIWQKRVLGEIEFFVQVYVACKWQSQDIWGEQDGLWLFWASLGVWYVENTYVT